MDYDKYLKEGRFQVWGQLSENWPCYTIGNVHIYDFSKITEKQHKKVTLALQKKHPNRIAMVPNEEELVTYLRGAGVQAENHKVYKRFLGIWWRATNLRLKQVDADSEKGTH